MNSLLEDLRELCQMPGLKGLLAFASTWALTLVGHPESAAVWLLSLMVMDLALGLARAWREGSLKGKRLTGGAFKFFRYWLAVSVFVMADAALIKAFPAMPVSLRDTFIAYLAINEAFSCIEKLAFFGMPIPEPFLKRLQNYREECLHGWEANKASGNPHGNDCGNGCGLGDGSGFGSGYGKGSDSDYNTGNGIGKGQNCGPDCAPDCAPNCVSNCASGCIPNSGPNYISNGIPNGTPNGGKNESQVSKVNQGQEKE